MRVGIVNSCLCSGIRSQLGSSTSSYYWTSCGSTGPPRLDLGVNMAWEEVILASGGD